MFSSPQKFVSGIHSETEQKEAGNGKTLTAVPVPGTVSVQKKEAKPNLTGLPDHLKQGTEKLSGYHLNDVKVHYNSDKPAQLHALVLLILPEYLMVINRLL